MKKLQRQLSKTRRKASKKTGRWAKSHKKSVFRWIIEHYTAL